MVMKTQCRTTTLHGIFGVGIFGSRSRNCTKVAFRSVNIIVSSIQKFNNLSNVPRCSAHGSLTL